MQAQKPTVGRIVLYKLTEAERQVLPNNGATECAAVVVRVWSDTCVNLRLLLDGTEVPWRTSVSEGDGERKWRWPERV